MKPIQIFRSLLILISLFSASSALADFNIIASYAYEIISPGDVTTLNNQVSTQIGSTFPGQKQMSAFGGDLRYYLPGGLGFGGRYEAWTNQVSAGGITQTMTANRTSLLVGYRFVNTLVFLGLIGSYGLSDSMKITTTGFQDLTPSSQSSYSVGAEGGIKMGHILLGAELGYLSHVGKSLQQNGASLNANMDLSGVYAKLQVGLSI